MRAVILVSIVGSSLLAGCASYHPRPLDAPVLESAFRARTLDDPRLQAFVQANIGSPPAIWPPRDFDLKTLVLVGYYFSPDLEVARAQLAVAEAGIRAAGARVNPSLGVDAGYDTEPGAHDEYGILPAFTIETAGKRGYRILRAEREADSAALAFVQAGWQLRSRVRSAFLNQLLASARLDVLQREESIRSEIVQIFDRRLAVGEVARPELDVYRVDLITTEAALRVATGEVAQARAALASAIGVPVGALNDVRLASRGFDVPVPGSALPIARVQRAGLLHRADVRRALADYAAADAGLRLELARQYPDLVLTPGYTFEEGFVRYVLNTAIEPLSVFHRNQGPIAVAEARRQEAAERFEALQSHAIGEMERAILQYDAAFEEWREADDQLVTTQRDREAAARRALEVGEGDRLSVATVRLETVTAERTRLDALSHVYGALGVLEDAMQQPLEEALAVADPARTSLRKGGIAK